MHAPMKDDLVQIQDWCLQTLSQVEEFEKASRVYQVGSRPKEVPDELKKRVRLICQKTTNEACDHWRDLVILHSLVTHFSLQGDEALRTFVFRHLYHNDSSHLDSLYRLTSLALTTNQTRVLDQVALWIRFHSDASTLTKLILSDLSILDTNFCDVLRSLPKMSIMFTEAFTLALTDTFSYTTATSTPPSKEILNTVITWISDHPELLLVPVSTHYNSDSKHRKAAIGLLRWTAGHAWSGRQVEDTELISNLHFLCLKSLGNRENVKNNHQGTFNAAQVKQVMLEMEEGVHQETGTNVKNALTKIAHFVQVCCSMGYFGTDLGDIKESFTKHSKHELISMVLRKMG